MKGSTKFWIIILTVLFSFINYKIFNYPLLFKKSSGAYHIIINIIAASEVAFIGLFLIVGLFMENGLLCKFNNWLDEKF